MIKSAAGVNAKTMRGLRWNLTPAVVRVHAFDFDQHYPC